MFEIDQFRAIEREFGLRYPAALRGFAAELDEIASKPEFTEMFPGIRCATSQDVREAKRLGLSEPLVPFMCEMQPDHTDFYCCDCDGALDEPRVAVFALHSLVADWPSLAAFTEWIRQTIQQS